MPTSPPPVVNLAIDAKQPPFPTGKSSPAPSLGITIPRSHGLLVKVNASLCYWKTVGYIFSHTFWVEPQGGTCLKQDHFIPLKTAFSVCDTMAVSGLLRKQWKQQQEGQACWPSYCCGVRLSMFPMLHQPLDVSQTFCGPVHLSPTAISLQLPLSPKNCPWHTTSPSPGDAWEQ